jgi:hypothetical protein
MKNHQSAARDVTVALLLAFSAVQVGIAEEREKSSPPVTLKQMKGSWMAALSGVTGCGVSTLLIEFTLDEEGKGTQTTTAGHSAACGDNTYTGFPVEIQSLNDDGSGFIAFGCGEGCGFGFTFQVARNKQVFNMVAQPVPGNYLAGSAIKK